MSELFIGLAVSKLKTSVALAEDGRNGEVRFFGDIDASPAGVAALATKLAKRGRRLHFCYEASDIREELISPRPELSPIFGDGLKDQAAAVWA
jgi:hypothetical protein